MGSGPLVRGGPLMRDLTLVRGGSRVPARAVRTRVVCGRHPPVPRLMGRRQRRTHCMLHPVPLRLVFHGHWRWQRARGPPATERYRPRPPFGERPVAV
ncbi:hypothetical protein GCM10022295_40780 [Streptomyces osmaniensis]|uniref:Uncharacterized protein n=1 Tax=Streptomyces osmaniensis TaxID=593134 RepID=A0ABP6WQ96_9ACTN